MEWRTTTQILEQLRTSGDGPAWEHFIGHFRPVVVAFGIKVGLSADQAQDAAQETLMELIKGIREGRFNRSKGRLSSWLFGIAKRVVLHHLHPRRRSAQTGGAATDWQSVPDEKAMAMTWETQWQRVVLGQCLEQVRGEVDETVFDAFQRYALHDVPAEQVARDLHMTTNAVYIAKSRVLSRLRERVDQLEDLA